MPAQDVVVYIVKDGKTEAWGRDTLATAKAFCARPIWPAKSTDSFVAVDDWGYGQVVAASPHYQGSIGESVQNFRKTL